MTRWLERPSTKQRRRRNRDEAVPNADGSPLEGFVEFPADGAAVERRTEVAGWHAYEGRPVAAVTVELDGAIVSGGRPSGAPRHDVAALHGGDTGYLESGWVAELDLRGVQAGTATLTVTVHPGAAHGGVRLAPVTVRLLGEPTIDRNGVPIPPPDVVLGRLDVPPPAATVSRAPLLVRGWARCTSGAPVGRVELSVDGRPLGRARLGLDRLDVAATYPAPDAPVSGFEQVVDLGVLEPTSEPVTLRARAVALDGTVSTLTVPLTLVEPPVAAMTARAPARAALATDRFDLLVVTHDLGLGGAQLWLHELLVRSGAGRAYPCEVVAFGGGPLRDALVDLGVDVHVSSPLPVGDAAAYEGRLAELGLWLGTSHHTVALVNTFRAFGGADLAERHGIPVVWAVHESWPEPLIWAFDHPGVAVDPAVRAAAARALGGAGAVVFESEATRALYEDRAPARTVVVPYGVDTAALDRLAAATSRDDARRALGLPTGRVLLAMGTLEPRKSQTVLVEAFAQVAAAHPDATLALVGDLGTPYSAALRELVARTGLTDRVRVERVTADATTWYRACDALVCASDVESLPRSVLDAMCLGLPVVATSVFGLAELLDDGVTGVLFEPNDLVAAAAALDRVLSMEPAALARLADAGRALVHERHDAAGYTDDVLALLRGLHADPTARPADLLGATAARLTA